MLNIISSKNFPSLQDMNVTPYKIYIYLVVCCIVNFDLFPGVRTTYPVISTIKETPGPEEICENFEEKIREIGAGGRGER